MYIFVAVFKVFLSAPILGAFLVNSYIWKLTIKDEVRLRKAYTKTTSFYARVILWCMNTKLKTIKMPPANEPYLKLGNHLGMIDILLIASARPTLFITSQEMRDTPFLGIICEMAGCLFVDRRNRAGIAKEITQIREVLKQGFSIVLYPEGTSTNGVKMLPFKKSLITAATGTGVPVLPMVINFTHVNGEPMSWKYRNNVCWYGDQTFAEILWRMMKVKEILSTIEFFDPIHVHSDEERHAVAERAQQVIKAKFVEIPLGPNEVSHFTVPKSLSRTSDTPGLG